MFPRRLRHRDRSACCGNGAHAILLMHVKVVRYLEYLDLRIRYEGWEVELFMRAEAARLAGKVW